MPPGHHLVYFPPQVTISDLLPDGTDILHTPGPPFNRRVWAGGRITFPGPNGHAKNLQFDGQRAVCVEKIDNVDVRGPKGDEKIFVTIDRRFTLVNENEDEAQIRARVAGNDREMIVEKRTLCFMPDYTESANQPDTLAPVRRRIPGRTIALSLFPFPNPLLTSSNHFSSQPPRMQTSVTRSRLLKLFCSASLP